MSASEAYPQGPILISHDMCMEHWLLIDRGIQEAL